MAALGAQSLFAQREYELREQRRDQQVERQLASHAVPCHWLDTQCRFAPGTVLSKTGDVYKVFTPFKRDLAGKIPAAGCAVFCQTGSSQAELALSMPAELKPMQDGDQSSLAYPVAEQQILQQVCTFLPAKAAPGSHQLARDFPAKPGFQVYPLIWLLV